MWHLIGVPYYNNQTTMAVPKASKNDNTPSSSSASSSSAATALEIKFLLQQLRKSSRQRKKQRTTTTTNSAADRDDALRLDKLRKIFARLIDQQDFTLNTTSATSGDDDGSSSASSQWKAWLSTQHEAFITHCMEGIVAGKTTALRTFCGVLASSPVGITGLGATAKDDGEGEDDKDSSKKKKGESTMVSERLLNKLLESIVKSRHCFKQDDNDDGKKKKQSDNNDDKGEVQVLMTDESILNMLESEFIKSHRDVQYFIYKGVHQIALDLLAGLERVATKTGVGNSKGDKNDDDVTRAEDNAGIVAENMCRLLMSMNYVPKTASDLDQDCGAGYLFPPPILSEDDDNCDVECDDNSNEEEDSEDSSSDEEEEEEEATSKKRKKQGRGVGGRNNNNNNKRSKKTKLIAWQQPYKHRNAHQEAWLSILRLPNLPSRTQKQVLQHLSTYVLKVCPSPLRFAEYFTRSFQGGMMSSSSSNVNSSANSLISILSLHGLFILMLDHQLEYPQFYNSLYQLLHPRILYTKHRSRFLRLLSKSLLSNSMLPAYVVASFCKKLCRLALSGPPSGGLFVLALVSNLLRKHGECACLIHRRGRHDDGGLMEDVFVEDVDDLVKTRGTSVSFYV